MPMTSFRQQVRATDPVGANSVVKQRRRGRPTGRDASETRAILIAAAEKHFDANSYADVRLDQIAATAGVSGPAIYNHFGSKDELFLAAVKNRILRYNKTISDAVAIEGSWKDRFNNLLKEVEPLQGPASGFQMISGAVIERLREDPEGFRELRDLREESASVFRNLACEAIEVGDLPKDTDCVIAGELLMAITVSGINTVSFYHPEPEKMPVIMNALKGLLGTST